MMAEKHQKRTTNPALIAVGVALILCGIGFACYMLLMAKPSGQQEAGAQVCGDKECFMAAANECQDVVFTSHETVGTVQYASKGCVFTKTIVKSSESELPEMKVLLKGKSLTCKYKIGEFDKRWLTTLIYGINYCKGGLKEMIGNLLLFAKPSSTP